MMNFGNVFKQFSEGFSFANPNLVALEENLRPEDAYKLRRYMTCWDFYDGYHYADIPKDDKPQSTQNWARKIVDTYVSSEFNAGVSYGFDKSVEDILLPYINGIWEDNNVDSLLTEIGQMKNVTGDGYIHISFEKKTNEDSSVNDAFEDPFGLYAKGRIRLYNVPSSICYPRWKDGYDTGVMDHCTIIYPMQIQYTGSAYAPGSQSLNTKWKIVKYVYYPDHVEQWDGKVFLKEWPNPYGVIPIVHFKNLPLSGRHYGLSDLEDIIPLNVELNLKNSDISEILDYHASPVTCIFGAKASQLDKGANKVWGGLPKDGKVTNLELKSDLGASSNYIAALKDAIHEIGGIPKVMTGADKMHSNVSGIALQMMFMPLTLMVDKKHKEAEKALRRVNQIAIKIGIQEGILDIPKGTSNDKIYRHKCVWGDFLPRDTKAQLEQVQSEYKMGLESRRNAMERLKKDNIEELILEIDKDRKDNPFMYGIVPVILSAGQQLIDPSDGNVLATNTQVVPSLRENENTNIDTTSSGSKPSASKVTGINKDGKDMKVVSGDSNFNPGHKPPE